MNIETEKNRLEDIWFSFQFNNNMSFLKCPLSIVRNCQELVKGKNNAIPNHIFFNHYESSAFKAFVRFNQMFQ